MFLRMASKFYKSRKPFLRKRRVDMTSFGSNTPVSFNFGLKRFNRPKTPRKHKMRKSNFLKKKQKKNTRVRDVI